jgi:hypothetical protein
MGFKLRSSGPFKMMGSSPVTFLVGKKTMAKVAGAILNPMGSIMDEMKSPARQTTTSQDETKGDIEINDPIKNPDGSLSSSEGKYGPGKGKQLSELSKKELKALGFSPKKIKEIMADGAKNPMSQEEVLEDIANPRTRTAK